MCKVYVSFYKLKRPMDRKTDMWEIISINQVQLGIIRFSGAWRQYVFESFDGTYWSYGCLEQVIEFLKEQNEKWRRKIRGRK
jgi:hypothetical protein